MTTNQTTRILARQLEAKFRDSPSAQLLIPHSLMPWSLSTKHPGDYWTTPSRIRFLEDGLSCQVEFIAPGGDRVWSNPVNLNFRFQVLGVQANDLDQKMMVQNNRPKTFEGFSIE